MIARVIEPILAVGSINPIVVVTGHLPEQIQQAIAACNLQFVHNPDFDEGEMLSSVKTGVAAVARCCDAFFLVLGDQPLIQAATYDALSKNLILGKIVQPTFTGKRGHPILLSSTFVNDILALPASATLKDFTSAHRGDAIEIAVNDSGITTDIDTPEDYHRAVQEFSTHRSRPCINPMATV